MLPSSGSALFIEDNPDVAIAGTAMLETCGFDVLHVTTAEDGLDAFNQRHFDLILSDICLPGPMDGIQLATALRGQRPDLRIILTTGFSDRAEAAEKTFIVLRKPFGMDQFRAAVRNVMSDGTVREG